MHLTAAISRWTRGSAGRHVLPLIAIVLAGALFTTPASAGHGRRAPRVSFCDLDGCSIRGRHYHPIRHREYLSEFERGFRLGDRDGSKDGFADGRYGRAFCETPLRDLSCYSHQFVDGYRAAYHRGYRDGYREGVRIFHHDRRHRRHHHHRRW